MPHRCSVETCRDAIYPWHSYAIIDGKWYCYVCSILKKGDKEVRVYN